MSDHDISSRKFIFTPPPAIHLSRFSLFHCVVIAIDCLSLSPEVSDSKLSPRSQHESPQRNQRKHSRLSGNGHRVILTSTLQMGFPAWLSTSRPKRFKKVQKYFLSKLLACKWQRRCGTDSKSKECVAVLTMLYKKNGAVTHVGSDFLFVWALHLARYSTLPHRIQKQHAPWSVGRQWSSLDTQLDQIWLWANINRNCNIFLQYNAYLF